MAKRRMKHRTVAVDVGATPTKTPRRWPWPWYAVAVAGPVAVLLAGWLLAAAIGVVGWLTSPDGQLSAALRVAGGVVVLAHGAPVSIAGQSISLAPLGLTAILIFLALPMATIAARQAASQAGDPGEIGRLWADTERIVWRVGATFAGVHAVAVALIAAGIGAPSWRAITGGLVVGGLSGLWGAARGLGHDPTAAWPPWLRVVPRALTSSLLVMLVGSAALLTAALLTGAERVGRIFDGLDPGVSGLILLIAIHILYLPNILLACASWIVGAGVTMGDGSQITMAVTEAGLLPAIPILGVVPDSGAGSPAHLWWLLIGVVAGAVAGLAVTWARPEARFDETALVGGLSGIAAGAVLVLACAAASGGLGSGRLSHIGARLGEAALFAPGLLGVSGMAAGLLLALARRRMGTPGG